MLQGDCLSLNIPAYPATDDWVVYWKRDNRSAQINTSFVTTEPYFVSTTIDETDTPCNNSPVFNSEPIVRACIGETTTYELFASDPDGDELRYSLVAPRTDTIFDLQYLSGYSVERPVTMSSDASISTNGALTFDATIVDELGMVDVLVEEYRGSELIGQTIRGLQISTYDCTNERPVIEGFEDHPDSVFATFCAGTLLDTSNSRITGFDPDTNNAAFSIISSDINVNVGTNGNAANPELWFEWQTTEADTGLYNFILRLTDDGCPTNQFSTLVVQIEITSIPSFDLGPDEYIRCDVPKVLDPTITFGAQPFEYVWYANDLPIFVPDTVSQASSYSTNDFRYFWLNVTDANGCEMRDSIRLMQSLFPDYEYEEWCIDDTTKFQSTTENFGSTIVSEEWYVSETLFGTGDSAEFAFLQDSVFQVRYVVENSLGSKWIPN